MESWLCVCVCVGGGCDCHLFLLTRVHLPSHSWTRKGLPISQQLGLSANQAPAWLPTAGKVKSTGRRGSGGVVVVVVLQRLGVVVREWGQRQLRKEGREGGRQHGPKVCNEITGRRKKNINEENSAAWSRGYILAMCLKTTGTLHFSRLIKNI